MTALFKPTYFVLHFILLIILAVFTTPYMATAAVAYSFFLWGLFFCKQTNKHIPLMAAGMILDVSLVLVLELQRSAIATALGDKLNFFQLSHIAASTTAVILYIPVAILGYRRWKKKSITPATREWHIRLGITAFIFRTLGFFLMFSLLEFVQKS